MRLLPILLLSAFPVIAFAAGSDSTEPPKPTETTTECKKGEVWDEKTKACIKADGASLNDDTRFKAVRELAYAGRPEEALAVLATMHEGKTDRVLTYLGFANRKAGRVELGLEYYAAALAQNPDNIQTRSYLGQAYIEMGETDLARAELTQIRNRGGAGTWAETSLAEAVISGKTVSY
jgi:Flp pilus assembly protein TadD